MKLLQALKQLFILLEPFDSSWAVCGGIAASVYRDTPRFTGDIDIAVIDHKQTPAIEIAETVLKQLHYTPMAGFIADRSGILRERQALVIGREPAPETFLGVDFLLPTIPWVRNAVTRAQSNLLDYGFTRAATITVEDLLLAKLLALRESPERITDQDDINAILKTNPSLDPSYIRDQATSLDLLLPTELTNCIK